MKKFDFKGLMTKAGKGIKTHSPVILLVTGIAAGVGAVVTAIIETPKAENIVKEAKHDKEEILAASEKPEYTEEMQKKDVAKVTFGTAGKLALVYLPSIGLGIASVAAEIGSYAIMHHRNGALQTRVNQLSATVNGMSAAFSGYRNEIIKKYGKDADWEAAHPKEERIIDNGDGTITVVEKSRASLDDLSFLYGESGWSLDYFLHDTDPEQRIANLYQLESMANDYFQLHPCVNAETIIRLFLHPDPDWQAPKSLTTYWCWDKAHGDDRISFGIRENPAYSDKHNQYLREWNFGEVDHVWLTFNCTGNYLQYAEEEGLLV